MAWGVFWISLILCHPIMADTMTIQWPLFVKQTPYGTRFTVRDHKKTIRVVMNQTVSYSYGDTIQLTGTSRGCRRARNRGMFDECRWWYRQGIDAQWRIDRHHRLATSQKPAYLIYFSNTPTRIYTTLQQYFPNHAGLAYTFIFGSRVDMVDSRQKMNTKTPEKGLNWE